MKVSHQPKTKKIPVVVGNQMNACSTEEHAKGTMSSSDSETEEAQTTTLVHCDFVFER